MRLKSLLATNQRLRGTCVANIFMLCLLTNKVWSFANIKHNRFARQLNDELAINYEDFSTINPYHQPHFTGNRSVIVQLFEWKFVDIAAECRDFLGPQGYAGVQLSPVFEHTVVKSADLNHPWWERLEVVSYRLASRSGNEMEFWSMSRICNEHGVRIYADVVINHMAAPLHYMDVTEEEEKEEEGDDFFVNTLLETDVNLAQLNYSNVPYTPNDFHKPACMIMPNTRNAQVIRNCQLNGHPDLDHSLDNVQDRIVEMLNKFVDMGVAGFRIDGAKYMWPIDLKNIFNQVKNLSTDFNFKKNSRPFVYYDVFDLGLDAVSKTEYSTYGVVSEYLYAAELSTTLSGKVPLSALINWGPALGFLSHEDSLVFVDSHDTQRGLPWEMGHNQMLTHKQRSEYIMANIFMLVHPYGAIKRIMSSYYFPSTDINQGPPVEEADAEEIRSPKFNEQRQCTQESGWVCEHRWPQMVNLIKVANYFRAAGNKEQSIIYFQTNGPNQVAFCRGRKAFVAINNDVENDFIKEVYGCLEPGRYCDMVTGGKKDGLEECHGKILEINNQGYIKLALNVADNKRVNNEQGIDADEAGKEEESGDIQSYGIVVIYVESKLQPADTNEADGTEIGETEDIDTEQEQEQQYSETEHENGPTDEQEEEEEEVAEVNPENEEEVKEEIVNEDSNDPAALEEAKGSNENEEEHIEEVPSAADSAKEDEEKDPLQDAMEEADKELASSDTGNNNQSRNLDEKNTDETEEQIEKPSAEIVDQAGDISDTVTAKIQDIQTAGFFSNNG